MADNAEKIWILTKNSSPDSRKLPFTENSSNLESLLPRGFNRASS
ncbi:hypothetical protein SZSBPVYA_CDS0029 [Pseudomonas phage PBJ]|uniref:Uncharacterized protein n=1 Tax=Pseudomonas phage vB_PaeM_PE1 TaxID=3161145 RepID=A0AAU8EIZ8_9CAUD|nr:hypothetical protein 7712_00045 [Pseudomonas phage bmx-p2]WFG37411.1 hypothetical protein 20Oct199_00021 [Pseudomonas phage 20Oct199]WOZ54255.1 hypothetical protein SZSBPVYA_CDS0029 [Pseudomonas phage PBJ]